jgi:hypothetical protein
VFSSDADFELINLYFKQMLKLFEEITTNKCNRIDVSNSNPTKYPIYCTTSQMLMSFIENQFAAGLSEPNSNDFFNNCLKIMTNLVSSRFIDIRLMEMNHDKTPLMLISDFMTVISTIPVESIHKFGPELYPFINEICTKMMKHLLELDIELLHKLFMILEQGLHSFVSTICITTFYAIQGITSFCISVRDNPRNGDIAEKLQNVVLCEQNQFFKSTIDTILRTFLRLETMNLSLISSLLTNLIMLFGDNYIAVVDEIRMEYSDETIQKGIIDGFMEFKQIIEQCVKANGKQTASSQMLNKVKMFMDALSQHA